MHTKSEDQSFSLQGHPERTPNTMKNLGFWYDGQPVQGNQIELSTTDPGLIYGATVFTTLRVYASLEHPLTHWQGHCDRLRISIEAFGWQLPNWKRLRAGAEWMKTNYPVLRVVIFPDGREWITGRSLPPDLVQRQQQGITAWVAAAEYSRSLPQHKTGNYLAPWLALQMAQRRNAQEAILTDTDGNWLESSTGTLWGWSNGQWWTPPLATGILPGLLRSRLISELRCQNEEVVEQPWTPELVEQFAAIAYTNCVMEIIPIHTVLWSEATLNYNVRHPALEKLRQGLSSS